MEMHGGMEVLVVFYGVLLLVCLVTCHKTAAAGVPVAGVAVLRAPLLAQEIKGAAPALSRL